MTVLLGCWRKVTETVTGRYSDDSSPWSPAKDSVDAVLLLSHLKPNLWYGQQVAGMFISA
jgi:hypothetical protein